MATRAHGTTFARQRSLHNISTRADANYHTEQQRIEQANWAVKETQKERGETKQITTVVSSHSVAHMHARDVAPQGLGNANRIGIIETLAPRFDLRDVRVPQTAQHKF